MTHRILIVTLDPAQGSAIKRTLTQAGFIKPRLARDSREAIRLLSEHPFDAMVTSVGIEPVDGWRLARIIRSGALTTLPGIPIIMLSDGYSERIGQATARAFQVNRFITSDHIAGLPAILGELLGQGQHGIPRASLLLVENDADAVALVKQVLGNRFDIDVATTGKGGLQAWRTKRHELVLLDLMLPDLPGDELLRSIIQASPRQSVVMMTGQSSPGQAARLIVDGAVDFIAKPFRADQLRQVCEIALQREDFLVSSSEFSQHERALNQEKELAQITLRSIADGVVRTDASGRIEYMNPVAETLTGWHLDEASGRPSNEVIRCLDRHDRPIDNPIERALARRATLYPSQVIHMVNHVGNTLTVDHVTSPLKSRSDAIIGAVMVFRDITAQRTLAQKLEYQASHDALTGLTNRSAFEAHLEQLIRELPLTHDSHALCYIDLDQFKVVNDTCGHIAGDQLLQQVANMILRKIRRNRDLLARFGGDEFVLLLANCPGERAREIAADICSEICDYRYVYDGKTFAIGASIGVVSLGEEITSANEALRMADNACYVAKEKGRNRVHSYRIDDQEMLRRSGDMHVVAKINHALEHDGFALFYQEIKPLTREGGKHRHIEILIRMKGEQGEWITPGFFLPAGEHYGVAPKIDRWVISSILDWLTRHQDCLQHIEMCSINLSGLSFSDENFAEFVKNEIQAHHVPPEKICFEITETAAIRNLQDVAEFINAMRYFGCSFALDDFGSGMSSYAYLKSLTVDYLKVDGMFVKDIMTDPIDKAMVKSINEIGHVFGLKTIAEFVESEDIMDALYELGVDFAQGYAIGKPTPIDTLVSTCQ